MSAASARTRAKPPSRADRRALRRHSKTYSSMKGKAGGASALEAAQMRTLPGATARSTVLASQGGFPSRRAR